MDVEEIRTIYARWAPRYDRGQWLAERLLLGRLRRRLLSRARGRVLDVGMGTGVNLPYYAATCPIVGVDLSRPMLERALARAYRLERHLIVEVMDAEALAFPDRTFDTVVSTLTLCTTPDPVRLLRELARVCRPTGRVLLLEHGLGTVPVLNWVLRRLAPGHLARWACDLTRDVAALPPRAGLEIRALERAWFGVFTLIEAAVGTLP
ncbi:MAG TPA: class I SAM-dependent methyltransferase [bacterium]|nr:class I SAM-dependent methyltransferase [bacterium]